MSGRSLFWPFSFGYYDERFSYYIGHDLMTFGRQLDGSNLKNGAEDVIFRKFRILCNKPKRWKILFELDMIFGGLEIVETNPSESTRRRIIFCLLPT